MDKRRRGRLEGRGLDKVEELGKQDIYISNQKSIMSDVRKIVLVTPRVQQFKKKSASWFQGTLCIVLVTDAKLYFWS